MLGNAKGERSSREWSSRERKGSSSSLRVPPNNAHITEAPATQATFLFVSTVFFKKEAIRIERFSVMCCKTKTKHNRRKQRIEPSKYMYRRQVRENRREQVTTVEPSLTVTSLVRPPPRYYGHFILSRRKAHTFSLKKTSLMWRPR